MRVLVLMAALVLSAPGVAADKPKAGGPETAGKKTEAGKAAPAKQKPAVRTLQLKSSIFQFNLRLEPGVPDPGKLEAVRIELAEVPPVPDPIYGETIPVKGAELVAEVTDADGAGYTISYRVHPLTDAGVYGFHFTPNRRDTYRVVLRGAYKSHKFSPEFKVPAGIWPFKDVDAQGNERPVPANAASNRLPALPGGSGPAVPGGGPAVPAVPAGPAGPAAASPLGPAAAARSPVAKAMQTLGGHWVELQVALFAGRRPDWAKVQAAAKALRQATLAAVDLAPDDPDFQGLMKEQAEALAKLVKAAAGSKTAPAREAFDRVGGRHCNRCHFVKRWKVIANPEEFPGGLP